MWVGCYLIESFLVVDLSVSSGDILEGLKFKFKFVKVCKYFLMLIMIGLGFWEGEGIFVF